MLLHDNMRPHMMGLTQPMLTTLKFEVLPDLVYNLDLSPCDYEVFSSLKKFLEGIHFFIDEEVKKWVNKWMLQIGAEF